MRKSGRACLHGWPSAPGCGPTTCDQAVPANHTLERTRFARRSLWSLEGLASIRDGGLVPRSRNPFLGRWRIAATDVWSADDLDGVSPAHVTFRGCRQGEMELLVIEADIDYRVGRREGRPFIEFSWEGTDDGQPISGRAWAFLEKRE